MKIAKIVEKSDSELAQLLTDTKGELAKLAIEMRTKKVSNIKQTNSLRKIVARALTIQREREITKLEQTHE
jgi:ribosomal protein L29